MTLVGLLRAYPNARPRLDPRSRAQRAGEGAPTYPGLAVLVVAAQPGHRTVAFVPPLGHQIEILIGRIERVEAARIAGVGAIDRAVRILVEDAEPRRFLDGELARSEIVVVAGLLQVIRGERDAEIVVEG